MFILADLYYISCINNGVNNGVPYIYFIFAPHVLLVSGKINCFSLLTAQCFEHYCSFTGIDRSGTGRSRTTPSMCERMEGYLNNC